MNLYKFIKVLKQELENMEKSNADDEDKQFYQKMHDWLDELAKWRLMMSEIKNEIDLSYNSAFSKECS